MVLPDLYTPEQCKKALLQEIGKRGLDDVLNEMSAILASWLNQKDRARQVLEECDDADRKRALAQKGGVT